jgi:hypothetical protein
MGTKNNPKNRAVAKKRKFQGKEVEPVYYYGRYAGHGNYVAAKYSGSTNLVVNSNNEPMQWKQLNIVIE